jgi:hypothetical protein
VTLPKSGPLTADELMALFKASVDSSYSEALFAAGNGAGLEVYSQLAATLARASQAIDRTTQSLYLLPFSGQTNSPAGDEANATVVIDFARTGFVASILILAAGTLIAEQTTDFGVDAPADVFTGRRYALTEDVVFGPGQMNATGTVSAERPGVGFNNPLPETITSIVQVGSGFTNTRGAVTLKTGDQVLTFPPVNANHAYLTAAPIADMFLPDHVGQYVQFIGGANLGKIARISGYSPPQPSAQPPLGSTVELAYDASVDVDSVTGNFVDGELVVFTSSGEAPAAWGRVTSWDGLRLSFVLLVGNYDVTNPVIGQSSGATGTIAHLVIVPSFAVEVPPTDGSSGGAVWRVLDWIVDYGLSATNQASPDGGQLGMLNMLGNDRGMPRATGESTDAYRRRISSPVDVVSPNAIRRAINRILAPLGLPFEFREVGSADFPGFFFDGDNTFPASDASLEDAYDTDVLRFACSSDPTGTFAFQEPVVLIDANGLQWASGWYGHRNDNPFHRTDVSTQLLIIRKDGGGTNFTSGDRIVGLTSGAYVEPDAFVPTTTADARRFRVYLDIVQFRAFFLIGLPRISDGEFGFAYDTYSWGAYDGGSSNYPNFYDGYPLGQANLYRQIYTAIAQAKAGGVGFDFYQLD